MYTSFSEYVVKHLWPYDDNDSLAWQHDSHACSQDDSVLLTAFYSVKLVIHMKI
jgi:hypothetical protein